MKSYSFPRASTQLSLTLILGLSLLTAGSRLALAHGDDMEGMDMGQSPAAYSFGEPGKGGKPSRTVEITMNDLSFTPVHLDVKTGETVLFIVKNASGIDHDFTLGDAAAQTAHRKEMADALAAGAAHHHHGGNALSVKAGATGKISWHFTKPGAFEYDCNVPGHFEAGMAGTLTVAP